MMIFNRYFLGILPGLIISVIFILLDKNRKNNIYKYIIIFLLAAISCFAASKLEFKVGSYFPEMVDMNWIMVLVYSIFGVAVFEEVAKWIVTLLVGVNSIGKFEIMVFAVISAMGFATFENVVYYLGDGSIYTAMTRAFLAVPSHACDAIIMGWFLIKMKGKDKKKRMQYLSLSLIVPIIIHAVYNAFLYKGIEVFVFINLLFYFTLLVICIKIVVQCVRSVENE